MAGSKRSDGPDSATIPPGLHFIQTRPLICAIKFFCSLWISIRLLSPEALRSRGNPARLEGRGGIG